MGLFILSLAQFFVVGALLADETSGKVDPTQIIAYQGDLQLTQIEIDAAFSKLHPDDRLAFIRDGGKVDQLIRALLRRKAIAADAARAGFDQDPVIAARVKLEGEKELAEAWLLQVMMQAPKADFETLAHEDYLANPDDYRSPELLDVSHILIGTSSRTDAEARELAASLEVRLRNDPGEFDALVMEYSDDPAKLNNEGRYRDMRRGMMVKPFEDAAFKLEKAGEISEPVQTDYGWHIIRLNGRSGNELRDFSEVRDEAMERAEVRYYETYRENYLRRLQSAPIVVPDEAVEVMARRHFGENLELAPNPQR